MAKRLSKKTASSSGKVLAALRTLVRRVRPAARPTARAVAARALPAAPAVPCSAERARAVAEALTASAAVAGRRPPAALSIQSHVASHPSSHVLEPQMRGVPVPPAAAARPTLAQAVERFATDALGAPRRGDAERRLNPHRADDRRPEAFAARVAAQADIPAGLARGASAAAEAGAARLARPFEKAWRALDGDQVQPIESYAAPRAAAARWAIPDAVAPHMSGPVRQGVAGPSPDRGSDVWFSGLFPFAVTAGWRRSLAAVLVIAVVAIAPVHLSGAYAAARSFVANLQLRGQSAAEALRTAGAAAADRDVPAASSALAAASVAFGDVRSALGPVGGALVAIAEKLPGGSRARTGATLLVAGDTLTSAGREFALRLSALTDDAPPTAVVAALRDTVARLGPDISAAAEALAGVNPEDIPAEHRAEVAALAGSADGIRRAFADFLPLADAVEGLLGAEAPKRYLLVFQNQHELRPTGGFIGSFAEVTIAEGRITSVHLPPGGSYDIQGDVRAWLNPPDPLRLVSGRWRFHDANWFPDFPTSADKLSWFYEKSGGPTVDGVIAVNATVLSELLAVTGPVAMPDYGLTLTSENVLDEIQNAVELHPADPTKPKQILTDLFPLLLARLQSPKPAMSMALADLVGRALRTHDIQIAVADPGSAATFARFGWDGALKKTDGDYLDVVVANIGGEKSDAVMRDDIMHEVEIGFDGRVTDTVTVTRTHRGRSGVPLTGAGNFTYLRLYVPEGSTLLSADGDFSPPRANLFIPRDPSYGDDPDVAAPGANAVIDRQSGTSVSDELGKTVFANWMQLLPGESKTVRFRYEIPGRLIIPSDATGWQRALGTLAGEPERGRYTLFLQKQSGANERYVTVRVRPPQGMRMLAAVPDDVQVTADDARLDVWHQTADRFIGMLFGF